MLLFKYIGEPDDTPNVHSGNLYVPGILNDNLYWAILSPATKKLLFYAKKSDYSTKKPPKLVINIDNISEVKRSKGTYFSSSKNYYHFQISCIKGRNFNFFTKSQQDTDLWIENLF